MLGLKMPYVHTSSREFADAMAKTGVARRWRLRLAALLIVATLVALLSDVAPHLPARRIVRAAAPAVSSRGVSSATSASMSSLLPSASWESVGGTSVGMCNGTIWTLHQLTRCPPPRQLHCFNGYASASNHRHSQWNAFTHIRPLLLSAAADYIFTRLQIISAHGCGHYRHTATDCIVTRYGTILTYGTAIYRHMV